MARLSHLMPETDLPAKPVTPSRRRVFASRLISTVILWTVIVVAFVFQKEWLVLSVCGFLGLAGVAEYARLTRCAGGMGLYDALLVLVALAWWAVAGFWTMKNHTEPPLWLDLAALVLVVHGSFLICLRRSLDGMHTLQRIFITIFGGVYAVVFFGFVLRLMYFRSTGQGMTGMHIALFLIMVTKFSDMGAYAVGVLFGRHKMIPHISPAKSWEGFVGAFLGSFTAAAVLMALMPEKLAPLTWTHALLIAPVLCVVAVVGDLAESVLKRCTAIKDSGHTLPGIGGILDLTDSLIFTAPVFYFYLMAVG